ncbi:MAG TPA: glycerophosphodiester phosphodiesterase family protein [Candidatus Thermoplasmatota archaeon]|nr:glycerophosphodiester phosphodiesterase family protein [Candidatus Thermoplasmatota archaeon]
MDWSKPPRVIAHRGSPREAPENTLASFRRGLAHTPAIELDVHLTQDGALVVAHDGFLGRTLPGRGRLGDLTLAQVRSLDAGAWFGPTFTGERVPTLEEALDLAGPAGLVDVEAKTLDGPYPGLVEAVGKLALARGMRDRVMLTSFDPDAAHEFKVRFPEMRSGLIAMFDVGAKDVEAVAHYADALVLRHDLVTAEVLAAARRQGLLVMAWTVNDAVRARELWGLGVDAVVTDVPGEMAGAAREAGFP